MGVIIDFIKLLGSIRTGITAAWLASGFFVFAQKIWPRLFTALPLALPPAWQWLPVSIFLVTGFVLLIWIAQAVGRCCHASSASIGRSVAGWWHRRQEPTKCETFILYAFTQNEECVNLERFIGAYNRLELIQARDDLVRKGLVDVNPWSDTLLTLTPRGRQAAMGLLK